MVTETYADLITLDGPPEFVELGLRALELVQVPLGALLTAPASVSYAEVLAAPAPRWAKGYWRGGSRRASVKECTGRRGRPKANLTMYLTLHELLGHGSDQDVLDGKRPAIRKLITPFPTSWGDVDDAAPGSMDRYWLLPSECYPNRLVEAITAGVVRSPYDDDYERTIPEDKLDDLVDIVVAPPPIEPQPDDPIVPALPGPPLVELDAVRVLVARADTQVEAAMAELAAGVDALAAIA